MNEKFEKNLQSALQLYRLLYDSGRVKRDGVPLAYEQAEQLPMDTLKYVSHLNLDVANADMFPLSFDPHRLRADAWRSTHSCMDSINPKTGRPFYEETIDTCWSPEGFEVPMGAERLCKAPNYLHTRPVKESDAIPLRLHSGEVQGCIVPFSNSPSEADNYTVDRREAVSNLLQEQKSLFEREAAGETPSWNTLRKLYKDYEGVAKTLVMDEYGSVVDGKYVISEQLLNLLYNARELLSRKIRETKLPELAHILHDNKIALTDRASNVPNTNILAIVDDKKATLTWLPTVEPERAWYLSKLVAEILFPADERMKLTRNGNTFVISSRNPRSKNNSRALQSLLKILTPEE